MCVVDLNECGCDCHRMEGVSHVMPCCDKPPLTKHEYVPDFYTGYNDNIPLACKECGRPEQSRVHRR